MALRGNNFAVTVTSRKIKSSTLAFQMFLRASIVFFTLAVFAACNRPVPDVTPKKVEVIKISFEVNDIRRYPIPHGFYPQESIFSPIDSVDKIWLSTHELNLLTGELTPLNSVFGLSYGVNIRKEHIWIDSITSNVYINCSYRGELIEYNAHNKTFRTLIVPSVSGFLAHKDVIFLGTSQGLYTYARGADSVVRAKGIPNGTRIFKIDTASDKNSLRLGTSGPDLIYRIRDSKLDTVHRGPLSPYPDQSALSRMLPLTAKYSYVTIEDDSLMWMHHQGDIYVKQGENILHVTKLDSGYLKQVRVDPKYLYLLFGHQFVILNKAAALKSAEYFDPESYGMELNAVNSIYYMENQSLQDKISKIDSLQNLLNNSVHPDIRERAENLNHSLSAFDDNLRPELELAIKRGSLPIKFKRTVSFSLIQYYTRQGNLDLASLYLQKLRKDFPDYIEQNQALSVVLRVKACTDSINELSIDADKKLYFRTLELQKLMQTGWFGESYLDDTIVADSYQLLLDTYPNSEFADNAAFYLLRRQYLSEEGMSYSSEAPEEYRRFIKKYPLSELKVSASLDIVTLYLSYLGQPEKSLDMLRKAKEELSRLSTKDMTELQRGTFLYYKSTVETRLKQY